METPKIKEYLDRNHGIKSEIIVFDLVNDTNNADSGLGIGYGDFSMELYQPKKKRQGERINEILLEIQKRILSSYVYNKSVLIIIQLGYWWWWKWDEERRIKELTAVNNSRGWNSFSSEQKKKWIRWNKELNILAERLIKWLEELKCRWIYIVDRKIKQFFRSFPHSIDNNINRNNKDVLGMSLMYYEGCLQFYENIKDKLGEKYYWNNYQKINNID